MWRWFVSMMDVPEMLEMLHAHIQRKGMSRASALVVFFASSILIVPFGYLYWRFDLASTWHTFTWIATGGAQEMKDAANADENTTAFVLMLLGMGATLMPSAVQFGLARFITIPALGVMIKASIAFDLSTDWPTMWTEMGKWAWIGSTFTWGPIAAVVRFLLTAAMTVVSSIVLQSIVILLIAITCYTAFILVMGGVGSRRTTVLEG